MDRARFLDVLRVAAIIAVVLMHTVTAAPDQLETQEYDHLRRISWALVDLTEWCVPVFLMISGYLFLNPQRELTFRKMSSKYCMRILAALFVFGVPFSLMEHVAVERSFQPAMLPVSFLDVLTGKSWAHLWYLYLILLLYLLTPLIKSILKVLPKGAYVGLIVLLLVLFSVVPFLMRLSGREVPSWYPEQGIYLFYYLFGYCFCTCKRKLDGEGYALIGLLSVFALEIMSRVSHSYSVRMAYGYPLTAAAALLMFYAAMAYAEKIHIPKLWSDLAGLSFGIYLIHPVFLNLIYKFAGLTLLRLGYGTGILLYFAVSLTGAAAVTFFMKKLPVFRKLL